MYVLTFVDYNNKQQIVGPFQSEWAARIHAEEDMRTIRRIESGWMKHNVGYSIIEVQKPGKTVSRKGVISRVGL